MKRFEPPHLYNSVFGNLPDDVNYEWIEVEERERDGGRGREEIDTRRR